MARGLGTWVGARKNLHPSKPLKRAGQPAREFCGQSWDPVSFTAPHAERKVSSQFQGTQASADAGRAGVQEELGLRRGQVTRYPDT